MQRAVSAAIVQKVCWKLLSIFNWWVPRLAIPKTLLSKIWFRCFFIWRVYQLLRFCCVECSTNCDGWFQLGHWCSIGGVNDVGMLFLKGSNRPFSWALVSGGSICRMCRTDLVILKDVVFGQCRIFLFFLWKLSILHETVVVFNFVCIRISSFYYFLFTAQLEILVCSDWSSIRSPLPYCNLLSCVVSQACLIRKTLVIGQFPIRLNIWNVAKKRSGLTFCLTTRPDLDHMTRYQPVFCLD